jgi:hypothetical protein
MPAGGMAGVHENVRGAEEEGGGKGLGKKRDLTEEE